MVGLETEGKITFSFSDALRLGYDQIVRRRDRALINIASVSLGIAFLSTLLLTDSFYRTYSLQGGAPLGVETYQYWLMLSMGQGPYAST